MKRHDTDENINFSKLEQEFYAARQADEKYSRENDAKFRAVHQKVASYEEFQDIVAASHLKPLDRQDNIMGGMAGVKQPWNKLCSGGSDGVNNKNALDSGDSTKKDSVNSNSIKTRDDFSKAWKMLPGDDQRRVDFLTGFDQEFLVRVFECDIPMNFMETALQSMNRDFSADDCKRNRALVGVLYAFTKSSRFALSLRFLGKRDKENVSELLAKLKGSGEMVEELMESFNVSMIQAGLRLI